MIPKRRSPYAPAAPTLIPIQTEYASPGPENYSTPPAPTTATSAPNYNGYGIGGEAVSSSALNQNISPSVTSTPVPVAHLDISTPSQGAIIAISVTCGLLLIALLLVILAFIGKGHEREKMTFEIGAGGGGGGSHRRKKHKSEKTYTDYGDIRRWRGLEPRRPFDPAFFRAGPDPGLKRNAVPPEYLADPRMQGRAAEPLQDRNDVEEVEELSEVSSTRTEGTKTSKSGSERGHRSSKGSRSHRKGHHRGQ